MSILKQNLSVLVIDFVEQETRKKSQAILFTVNFEDIKSYPK